MTEWSKTQICDLCYQIIHTGFLHPARGWTIKTRQANARGTELSGINTLETKFQICVVENAKSLTSDNCTKMRLK